MAIASESHLENAALKRNGAAPANGAVVHVNGKDAPAVMVNGHAKAHLPTTAADAAALTPRASWYLLVKHGLDRTLALVLLVLTLPILLVAMVLVKLTSPGPVIYSQTRVGRFGKLFTIYKLRSMIVESESLTGATWSLPGDQRVTRVGRWLRKTHIDELPQLWNVLQGDMSLIGPRPERPEFVPTLVQAIPHYRDRLLVRPGISGFAQVQLPPDTDMDSVRIKLAYDLHYVAAAGLWFDVRIAWATVAKMAGASFGLLRRVFYFPEPALIESNYRNLVEGRGEQRHAAHLHRALASWR